MSAEQTHEDARLQAALRELADLVKAHYPTAAFSVEQGIDDPDAVHLVPIVDLDEPDEVVDLTIDRVLELQLDEGLPVHVIPRRTPARVAALRQREQLTRPGLS